MGRIRGGLRWGATKAQAASLIVDKHGRIDSAGPDAQRLLHSRAEHIEGAPVSVFFPRLPFDPHAPQHNLAIADAWERAARWWRLAARTANGDSLTLEVIVKRLQIDNGQFILIGLRPAFTEADGDDLGRLVGGLTTRAGTAMISDCDGIIRAVNPSFEDASGFASIEIVGEPVAAVKPDLNNSVLLRQLWRDLLTNNEYRSFFASHKKTGLIFYEDTSIRPFINRDGVVTHLVMNGTSPSEPMQTTLDRLQHEAFHDQLTGLPNRSLFLDRLEQSIAAGLRHGNKFTVVYIDLDDFKHINDAYGHACGDTVLRATGLYLTASVRAEDTVARVGGDEFALILRSTHDEPDVEAMIGKILAALPDGACYGDRHIPIVASMGASVFPDDAVLGDDLIKFADTAMYAAKAAGGHCLRFFSAIDGAGSARD